MREGTNEGAVLVSRKDFIVRMRRMLLCGTQIRQLDGLARHTRFDNPPVAYKGYFILHRANWTMRVCFRM